MDTPLWISGRFDYVRRSGSHSRLDLSRLNHQGWDTNRSTESVHQRLATSVDRLNIERELLTGQVTLGAIRHGESDVLEQTCDTAISGIGRYLDNDLTVLAFLAHRALAAFNASRRADGNCTLRELRTDQRLEISGDFLDVPRSGHLFALE